MSKQRLVENIYRNDAFHWVGDGFYVMQVLPGPSDLAEKMSPFLLMDYHAPYEYEPTDTPRGVGVHPHRGFETVTLAFEGSVAHHDSTGAGGIIRPGDVQWMKAAGGILHKEYHEKEWASKGGRFHMMQLWVNLPAKNKMDSPAYQPLLSDEMGIVKLESGTVTIIAGEYQGVKGPAKTHSHINLWRVELDADGEMAMSFPATNNASIFVMEGNLEVNGTQVNEHELVLFKNEGEDINVTSQNGAHFAVFEGTPLNEPVVSYGPFVMNTQEEIRQATIDYSQGKFGTLV